MKIIKLKNHTCIGCGEKLNDLTKSLCVACEPQAEAIWQKIMSSNMVMVALIFIIASCNPSARLARKCAERFPVTDSLVIQERTITDTLILPDSWVEYMDTTVCPPASDSTVVTKLVNRLIPGKTVFVEKQVRDTLFVRENKARIYALNHLVDSLQNIVVKREKALAGQSGKTKGWRWAFIITLLVFAGIIAILMRKIR